MPTIQNTMFAIRNPRSFCSGSDAFVLDGFLLILLLLLLPCNHFSHNIPQSKLKSKSKGTFS